MSYPAIGKSSSLSCVLVTLALGAAARGDEEPPGGGEREGQKAPGAKAATEDRLWIGVEGFPADETVRTQLEIPKGQGFIVDKVHPESPAERAGLRRHDIILRAGGTEVDAVANLAALVQGSEGRRLELEILRAGKKLVLALTPGKLATREEEPAWTPRVDWQDWQQGWQGIDVSGLQDPLVVLNDPMTFRSLSGLAVLSQGQVPDLPDDVAVTVTKKGKEPASIEIRRGDESWKTTDRELHTLPADLWKQARAVLRALGSRSTQQPWFTQKTPSLRGSASGDVSGSLRRDIDRLEKTIDELRASVRKLEGERAPGGRKP